MPTPPVDLKTTELARELALFDSKPDSAYIDLPTLCALRRRSRASTYRDIQSGVLPAPRKIGRSSRWQVGAIRKSLAGGAV